MCRSRTLARALFVCAAALPVSIYWACIVRFAVDIPQWDDYDVVLAHLLSGRTFADRAASLVSLHNEHRVALTRTAVEIVAWWLGRVDFRVLCLVGNLAVLGTFGLILHAFRKAGIRALFFLPIPFMLFGTRAWENMTWATTALQNNWVLMLSILAIASCARGGVVATASSIGLAALAAVTSGSGLLAFPALLLVLLLELRDVPGRARSSTAMKALLVLACGSAVYVAYFQHYVRPTSHPTIWAALAHPARLVAWYFMFMGSYMWRPWIACVAGAVTLGAFGWLTYRRFYAENRAVYCMLAFTLMTGAMAALSRSGLGTDHALAPRYANTSIVCIVLTYVALVQSLKSLEAWRGRAWAVGLGTFAACAVSMVGLAGLAQNRQLLEAGLARWKASGEGLSYPDQAWASRILGTAIDKGLYRLPDH